MNNLPDDMQELLDLEAKLGNERYAVHQKIKLLRKDQPACFGQDDCSTMCLVRCSWRIDCETGANKEN